MGFLQFEIESNAELPKNSAEKHSLASDKGERFTAIKCGDIEYIFDNPYGRIASIKKDGVAKSFKTKASYIETTFDGDAEIEYAYLADDFPLTGEIADKRLAKWLIADGVVAEFCYAENMPVEAAAAYKRFTDGLKYLKNKSLRLTVLARRWPQ